MCQQYDKASQVVLDFLLEQGFSRTPRKYFCQASREFRKHLEKHHLEYSHVIAQTWVGTLKRTLPRWKFLSFRRSLALIDDAARNGCVTNTRYCYGKKVSKYQVPECLRPLLGAYLQERKQDGNQSSTVQMDASACSRFLLYLQSKGMESVEFITPQAIKDYQAQAEHRTPEGKNAYLCRIRGFVRFLARKKLVPETLEFAFAAEKASRVSIITTLSKEQVATIRNYSKTSSSASELRSVAMTTLALRMGYRSIDICNLCLSDISWELRTISIIQQKTGAPLTLPFPVEVGNLLARYILEARPKCDFPYVFITLKHPYAKLTSSRCYISTLNILGRKEGSGDVRGLHVVRRTFASNLLEVGNPVPMISATLGHADDGTVDEYLATDGQRMRQCAIGLAGIEIRGAFR
ncbi:MAG: tyrosine-type recombinase/integrase [Rectinemataceae bacterium]|nr:tyrosine-type recombinase/integrase [Rectinemataceae bacterium]